MTSRLTSPRVFLLLLLAALTGWVFLLRGPTFDTPVWNVDEAIHASVARTLLDGGVLYRDAVDQRTPLTYYVFAAIFAVAGPNNLWAVHAVLAGVIVLTGAGLILLARRAQTLGAGAWAAFIFAALSTNLLDPGDGNAAHTEWFAVLFTTWGAWWFWRTIDAPGFRSAGGWGALILRVASLTAAVAPAVADGRPAAPRTVRTPGTPAEILMNSRRGMVVLFMIEQEFAG